ncbi:MAG: hypothetical protein ACOC34_03835 [Thermotogota bacterium]
MSLTYSFKTSKDLLSKLKRECESLKQEVTGDRFFNFIVTAYHIIDWIKKDPTVPKNAKLKVNQFYKNTYIAICRDICNASKHFSLSNNYENKITDSTTSRKGFGYGRMGAGLLGDGEESIIIVCSDGTSHDALDLAQHILDVWEVFFREENI